MASPTVTSAQIYGGTNNLVGPGLVSIGDTFTLNPTFQQPLTPSAGYPYSSTVVPPATTSELAAFDAFVAAMGYTGTPANSQTVQGTGLSSGANSAFARTNQYRMAVNQPLAVFASTFPTPDMSVGDASVQTFCTKMFTYTEAGDHSPADLLFNVDTQKFINFVGPTGASLFIFLGDRFAASYDLLGCASVFNAPNPVNLTNVNNTTTTPNGPYYATLPFAVPPPPH
jgi:hypothetical protein